MSFRTHELIDEFFYWSTMEFMDLLKGLKDAKQEPLFESKGYGDHLLRSMKPSFRPNKNLTLVIPIAEDESEADNLKFLEIGEVFKKINLNRLKVI